MTDNQLIEWWDNAERVQSPENPREVNMMLLLQAFYKQVAAHERERCALVLEKTDLTELRRNGDAQMEKVIVEFLYYYSKAIRALKD